MREAHMARYWKFNVDACTFEQCDRQTAAEADVSANERAFMRSLGIEVRP
jgi:hypothetical protein